jgi:NDP-sugar pyrophosphorylase family protein
MVISLEGFLEGVLTDGDVRRALIQGARLEGPLAPFVRRDFISVEPTVARDSVLDLMQAREIEQIPIVDEARRLIGLHTLHSILRREHLDNWAVVMAGGRGERLRPLTDSVPKPMVRVAGRPILERIVLNLVGLGIGKIFISVNYLGKQIEDFFGNGRNHGCDIEYLREESPLGTGGALSLLPVLPTEPLVVLNGDVLTQSDIATMIRFHAAGRFAATVAFQDYLHTVPFGVLDLAGDRVTGMREKPTFSWPSNAGIYVLEPRLIPRLPAGTNFPMPAVLEDCLERGDKVGAFRIDGDWIDIGRPAELRKARGEDE